MLIEVDREKEKQGEEKIDSYDYGPAEINRPIGFMINILPILKKIKDLLVNKSTNKEQE